MKLRGNQVSDTPTNLYIQRAFVREPECLSAVRMHGEECRPGMQLSPTEGQLLAVLVAIKQPRYILEIGTFVGYSALWMAGALPPGGEIIALEKNEEYAAQAAMHAKTCGMAGCVTIHHGDALETVAALPQDMRFDMVFIDAEKRRYPDYLAAVEPRLMAGALVVADNTLLFGSLPLPQPDANLASAEAWHAMQAFNNRLADDEYYTSLLLPTPEGLSVGVWHGGCHPARGKPTE